MKHRNIVAMLVGFGLDALLGDPKSWPHPVKLIGKQIEFEERLIRDNLLPAAEQAGDDWPLNTDQTEKLAGAALAADVALLAPAATWLLLKACDRIHPAVALAMESAICYQLIAARSLQTESTAVYDELRDGNLEGAREAVGGIVGRDTENLDEAGVAKAAVETIAENCSDGVVAPLVYMGFGGAPAAMLYKAVNTLDSMVGYKNDRYRNLGWAGARIDDICNIVPSRISGGLMCVAARFAGLDSDRAWTTFLRDRHNHTSPNSAQTEAACAGALGVQLGGGSYYSGNYVDKPTIGDATRPLEAEDIKRANKLMYATAILGLGAAACIGLLSKAGTKK